MILVTKDFVTLLLFKVLTAPRMLLTALLLLSLSVFGADAQIDFTAEEQEWIKNNPRVLYGFDPNYAPIEMNLDGKHSGMSADYVKLIEHKTGLRFEALPKSKWSNVYQSAIDGKVSVLSSLSETNAREVFLDFTPPYIEFDGVIITSKSTFNHPRSLSDLENKKMAVVQGYFWVDFIAKDYPNIELELVKNVEDGLIAVALGIVDAFLGAMPIITNYVSKHNISNLQISGSTEYSIALSFAVTKNKPILFSIIRKALASIPESEHKRIYKKWIKIDSQLKYYIYQSPQFKAAIAALILSVCFLLGFLLWNRMLTRKVKIRTEALAEMNDTLEERVALRTQELEQSNKELEEIRQQLKSKNTKLRTQVNVDMLTGIANRRKLEDRLTQFFREDEYLNAPYSILMIDVDYFKKYNDTYGHQQGDKALKRVAAELSKDLRRDGELVARYGGEEFSIFLANADEAKARAIAEDKIASIQAMGIEHKGSKISDYLTISIGVKCVEQGVEVTRKELIGNADKALYQAKESGRNQLVVYNEGSVLIPS